MHDVPDTAYRDERWSTTAFYCDNCGAEIHEHEFYGEVEINHQKYRLCECCIDWREAEVERYE